MATPPRSARRKIYLLPQLLFAAAFLCAPLQAAQEQTSGSAKDAEAKFNAWKSGYVPKFNIDRWEWYKVAEGNCFYDYLEANRATDPNSWTAMDLKGKSELYAKHRGGAKDSCAEFNDLKQKLAKSIEKSKAASDGASKMQIVDQAMDEHKKRTPEIEKKLGATYGGELKQLARQLTGYKAETQVAKAAEPRTAVNKKNASAASANAAKIKAKAAKGDLSGASADAAKPFEKSRKGTKSADSAQIAKAAGPSAAIGAGGTVGGGSLKAQKGNRNADAVEKKEPGLPEGVQKEEVKEEKKGFFAKVWDFMRSNPLIAALGGAVLGGAIGALVGGKQGLLIGALGGGVLAGGAGLLGGMSMSPSEKKELEAEQRLGKLRGQQEDDEEKQKEIMAKTKQLGDEQSAVSQDLGAVRKQLAAMDCEKFPEACAPLQMKEKKLDAQDKKLNAEIKKVVAEDLTPALDRNSHMAARSRDIRESQEELAYQKAENKYAADMEKIRKEKGMADAFDYYKKTPRPRREDFVSDTTGKTYAFKMDKMTPEEADRVRKDPKMVAVARSIEQPQTVSTDINEPERQALRSRTEYLANRVANSSEKPMTASEQKEFADLMHYRTLNDKRIAGTMTVADQQAYKRLKTQYYGSSR